MPNVFDTAQYILETTGPITALKLQKLLYYMQAWSLVWDEAELFAEDFEAWAGGPACPRLYGWHRTLYKVSAHDVPPYMLSGERLTRDQTETMDAVLRDYGRYSAAQLIILSRSEAPWITARHGRPQGAHSSAVIPKTDMARLYADAL